ncbi:signal peptidase I [Streptomyces sp. NBC_00572]|uniref:signal peptidase I n=1 Tax=Streptomyces sp. NBC_00572 TaxID=2903664 RepID=UPI0022512F6F|nr:signal peptidase I [Streptomyces sp. NBC_00572]MCX4983751.1 signal peptidase I [Streptomyces sp. NBC_00572]
MDTEAQHTERDPSSDTEDGSRSARVSEDARSTGSTPEDARSTPEGESDSPADVRSAPSWRRTALVGGACVAFMLLLSHFVMQPFLIPSGSMEPTLQVGDRILVDKLAYRFGSEPGRGDVVVFDGTGSFVREQPKDNPVTGLLHDGAAALGLAEPDETDFVKRVVGIGGDRVVCCDKDGRLTVNGVSARERYLMPGDQPSSVPFDIVVPQDKLWVMGDHRSQSSDSRDHLGSPGGGMVPVDKVVGRADWIVWPFGRWSTVQETDAFDAVPAAPAAGHGAGPHG